ncbi:NAD-dependent succinate-semialdehyde dehydrogenase [Litorivicinus lipolyticus]|uniref:NAD-dependent succinate-semialdehyde dehydrogenase n=1 Tax=Litorivicinus lipolyticus TaxID=418701 RepID=UPI003B59F736
MQLNAPDLFQQRAFIGGQWVDAPQRIDVTNPATGAVLGSVPALGAEHTRQAIDAAQAALGPWKATTAKHRANILKRWFELIHQHQDDLAQLMTLEQGKPLAEARGEVAYAASFVEWFAEEGKRAGGTLVPAHKTDARIVVQKTAVGVVAAIAPWNFPLAMITRKAAPALAAGCTFVVKPSELTPFSALALMKLAQQAGVPDGVLSCVTGYAEAIGAEMTANKTVRKLSFTGSTRVGKLLMAQSSETVKRLSLELGGNAPFIVFDDADLDAAVAGAMASKYRNAGQTCVCANRFYIQAGVYDAFVDKLTAEVAKLTVGNGLDEGITQGPLINQAALEKVERHVADAVQRGGTVVIGGQRAQTGLSGHFYQPTLITGVSADALLCREETFGPVAGLVKFDSEADVVAKANDSDFGLAAYFYSRDLARVWRVAEALESGIIGINEGLISTEAAPFGGVKQSGLGREGSSAGIEEYFELKYLLIGGLG